MYLIGSAKCQKDQPGLSLNCQHVPGTVFDLVGPYFFVLSDVAGFIIINRNAPDKSRLCMALGDELIYVKRTLRIFDEKPFFNEVFQILPRTFKNHLRSGIRSFGKFRLGPRHAALRRNASSSLVPPIKRPLTNTCGTVCAPAIAPTALVRIVCGSGTST